MLTEVAPGIAILITSCIAAYIAFRVVRYGRSGGWPETTGRVESYGRYRHLDNEGTRSLSFADIAYSYSVGGQFYAGQFLSPTLRDDDALTDFLQKRLPVGQSINVRYNPKHPGRSIIGEDISNLEDRFTRLNLE